MKSTEGRHQGVLRTGMIHPRPRHTTPAPPPANGVVITKAKVPSKATNHSNIVGDISQRSKYSNCHVSPAIKSAHNSKGRRNLQPWGEDKLDRLIGSGSSSAKDILDTLCDDDEDDHDNDN
ncbi:hypothetical protein CARUB_v10002274mg [Capsella rubella]|uniref:Uncharacterized protein n=1 Tax=Capsella rubella TaxID=81985 RepID=R0HDI3_9BRAS|nr:uncharacterized protein LOC17882344 [Capsella rubella]EOA21808.1 hypothetical protein CARUB_v10002274mg [Capsella rubella]